MTDWFIEAQLYEEDGKPEIVYSRGLDTEEDIEKFLESLEERLKEGLEE